MKYEIEDFSTEEDRANRTIRLRIRIVAPTDEFAARMLEEVPGTVVRLSDGYELLVYDLDDALRRRGTGHSCDFCGERFADGCLVVRGDHLLVAGAPNGYAHVDCCRAADEVEE